jgi:hypothetical protein
VSPTIFEIDTRTRDEIFDCAGYKHFTRLCFIRDANTHLCRRARNLAVDDFTLAGM